MRRMTSLATIVMLAGCASPTWSDDAVTRFVERAEMCDHWMGEEPYDEARRAEIERNINDLRCATMRRDGEALKLSRKDRPDDVRRIDAALAGF